MAFFILDGLDGANGPEIRKATRPAHLAWLESLGPRYKFGSPMFAEDGATPLGSSVVIVMFSSGRPILRPNSFVPDFNVTQSSPTSSNAAWRRSSAVSSSSPARTARKPSRSRASSIASTCSQTAPSA